MSAKISVPVIALGGEKGLGSKVGDMVAMVAENVEAHTLTDCGHFMIEERPEFVADYIVALSMRVAASPPTSPFRHAACERVKVAGAFLRRYFAHGNVSHPVQSPPARMEKPHDPHFIRRPEA